MSLPSKDYLSIEKLKQAYANGENILQLIKAQTHESTEPKAQGNSLNAIEIAYDLQAGSYIKYAQENMAYTDSYTAEQATYIKKFFPNAKTLLDAGCGELTKTTFLLNKLEGVDKFFACDLGWSAIFLGIKFAQLNLNTKFFNKLTCFCADTGRLPFPDKSIDVITTSHSLESNHGRESELITELCRVAKQGLVLFEPSYELGSQAQKRRMEEFGSIRNLPEIIKKQGFELIENKFLENYTNPLNRTAVYVICLSESKSESTASFVDPISKTLLEKINSIYFSPTRGISYPIVEEIPLLHVRNEILTIALSGPQN